MVPRRVGGGGGGGDLTDPGSPRMSVIESGAQFIFVPLGARIFAVEYVALKTFATIPVLFYLGSPDLGVGP